MSYGERVASVITERVPCTFAKPKHGKQGTHTVTVMLDAKGNLLWVSCECQQLFGDGAQAIHEMDAGKNASCFAWVAAFTNAVRTLDNANAKPVLPGFVVTEAQPAVPNTSGVLTDLFAGVVRSSYSSHNHRVNIKAEEKFREPCPTTELGRKARALQKTIDKVTGSILGLDFRKELGGAPARVQNHMKVQKVYPSVFEVSMSWVTSSDLGMDAQEGAGYRISLGDYNHIFAARRLDGSWVVREDAVKRYAAEHSKSQQYKSTVEAQIIPASLCIFCGESFMRMSKHTAGAKHIDRVLELVNLVCKATSPVGLRMLNNPKHRSAFLRRR